MLYKHLCSFFTFFIQFVLLVFDLRFVNNFIASLVHPFIVHLSPNKCTLPFSMRPFNSSRFLYCSMPHFGVSTTSPRIFLSFNMSPTSAIIFIKCRNRYHMKNNIRYKGNINNTSVIIFFNWRTKTPSGVTLLGRTPSEVFVMLLVVVHPFLFFILWLFFIFL